VGRGFSAAKRLVAFPLIAAGRVVLVVMRGDHSLNSAKLMKALSRAGLATSDCHRATASELATLGASYEWISLVRTPASVLVIADEAVRAGANYAYPSPRRGHLLINLNPRRDFKVDVFVDLRLADNRAACPRCGGAMRAIQGIEVGHVFKLGTAYTGAFAAPSTAPDHPARPLQMGCYGLGLTRLMATVAEQKRDERGLVWPDRLAPYPAIVIPLRTDARARGATEHAYLELTASGVDVLLDDSDGPPEDKQRQADLLGLPVAIGCSGDPSDRDLVELRERTTGHRRRATISEVKAFLSARP
jgi:prolyl-tRNA synthetase